MIMKGKLNKTYTDPYITPHAKIIIAYKILLWSSKILKLLEESTFKV